ncbi:Hypothetical protein PBC10988_4820 [Planctomycetales bacterium 10988]|nr:Hypothetical protein PBC10988_4820 [Planctomycetales bacterium 10988]
MSKMPSFSSQELKNAFRKVVEQANKGNERSLQVLRKYLEEHPELWQYLGDLARTAEEAWIRLLSSEDVLTAETTRLQLAALKEELLEQSENVLEKMLADTILATWLEVHYLRTVDANTTPRTATQGNLLLKRIESAQRRHHNAIKQLLQIRKLLPEHNNVPNLRIYKQEDRA